MKIRYYLDLYPGTNFSQHTPSPMAVPMKKTEGTKRFAFDVTIPDQLLYDIDAFAPEVSKVELVEDHSEGQP